MSRSAAAAAAMALRVALSPLLLCVVVTALWSLQAASALVPVTRLGPLISDAGGVALSGNGSFAYVCDTLSSGSVYIVPLPVSATTNFNPSPWYSTPRAVQVIFYFIAASQSASPQLIWLLDDINAQLVSLDATQPSQPAPSQTTLVFDFGIGNQVLIAGMFYQPSSELLFFSLSAGFNGQATDSVGVLDPYASEPRLQTVYSTSFVDVLGALALSSTQLYLGTASVFGNTAAIYAVPLPYAGATSIPESTTAVAVYTTPDSNPATAPAGDLIDPTGFILNAAQSILYLTDFGDGAQPYLTPQSVYALSALYSDSLPLNFTTLFTSTGGNTMVGQSLALSSDQSTLYFAASGRRNGLYYITAANSSVLPTLPPPPPQPAVSSSSAAVAALSSSARGPQQSSGHRKVSSPGKAPSASSSAGITNISGSGVPQPVLTLPFNVKGDVLISLWQPSVDSLYIGTVLGNLYRVPLPVPIGTSSLPQPIYRSSSGGVFQAVVVNPAQRRAIILDSRASSVLSVELASGEAVVLSSFTDEQPDSLSALVVDWELQPPVAYAASILTGCVYAIDTSVKGQIQSAFSAIYTPDYGSDITFSGAALKSSGSVSTLYLTSPTVSYAEANTVLSALIVSGLPAVSSATQLYSSDSWLFPDAVAVDAAQAMLYVLDGGVDHGYIFSSPPFYPGLLYACDLSLAEVQCVTLYSSDALLLRGGLQLTPDQSTLLFLDAFSLQELVLDPALAVDPIIGPPLPSSSSGGVRGPSGGQSSSAPHKAKSSTGASALSSVLPLPYSSSSSGRRVSSGRSSTSSASIRPLSSTGGPTSQNGVNCSFSYAAVSTQSDAEYAVEHQGVLQYSTASATVLALYGSRRITIDETAGSVTRRSTSLLPPGSFDKNDNVITPTAAPFFDASGLSYSCGHGGAGAACGVGQLPYVNIYYDSTLQQLVEATQTNADNGLEALTLTITHFSLKCPGLPEVVYQP